MSTIGNLGFEAAGTGPGFPTVWTVANVTARGYFAEFANLRAVERFEEGWTNNAYVTEHDPLSPRALFSGDVYVSPVSAESFEAGWTNTSYMLTTFAAIGVAFTPDADPFDGFGKGWDNDPYLYAFDGSELEASVHDGNGFEDFEQEWGNTGYALEWVGGETVAPSLSGQLAKSVEDFEDVKGPQIYHVDGEAHGLVTPGHGLGLDYSVILDSPISGTMPDTLAPQVRYYVQALPFTDIFQLALVPSAPTPLAAEQGSGLLRWSDPWEFWVTTMATI